MDQDEVFGEVAQRLRRLAQADRTFSAAQMQIINLQEIIRNAGPNWPRLKDKVRAGSMAFLKGCVADEDVVIPAGDGFLIIFAEGDPVALTRRSEELRALLLQFYLGDSVLEKLGVAVECKRIASSELGTMLPPTAKPRAESTTRSYVFAPAWSPRAKMVASYMCIPVHRGCDGAHYGYDLSYAEDGRSAFRDYCEVDLNMVEVIETALGRYAQGAVRPALGLSVHATTLQSRSARMAYLDRLARVPPEMTKHLFVRVAEVEPGTPTITLADWAGMLRSRLRHIVLEMHHTQAAPPNLSELGVWGAGYQAPPYFSRGSVHMFSPAQQVRKWAHALSAHRFLLTGLCEPAQISLAEQAGVALVTSNRFWPFSQWPGGVMPSPSPGGVPPPVLQQPATAEPSPRGHLNPRGAKRADNG
jgi:hypothetical protein